MKRITLAAGIFLSFLLIIGCSGGGKSDQKPPQLSISGGVGGQSLQSLQDLHCVSQNTQEICCNQGVQTMQGYSGYCSQVAVGQQPYALPPSMPQQSQTPSQKQGCAPARPMTCGQAVQNFELQFSTTYGTQAGDPQAQQWRQQQGANVVNCVGQQMGITSMDQVTSSPQLQCMVSMTSQTMNTQVPTTVTAGLPPVPIVSPLNTGTATMPNPGGLIMPANPTAVANTPSCGGNTQIVCL